ncbi:MAG: DUF1156 domain-containing protein [Thermomicrobiales bacterium]|nr:DUF1156 domain-containing protein [Thermomicrobiales bacterium]
MAKKLIEVALPLEEINKASAREKSIRHGHPSTLHLWWARRPLAAARAVIFSSLITDPGDPDYPWKDGQERDVEKERGRLHQLIVDLVQWENTTNETVLNKAREEILLHTDGNPPPLLDPFAGGGAIPLEAQRLGLEAHASDLNPVAVLINKAMIEIPPKFAGMPPVNPEQRNQPKVAWKGAAGLAEDVRYYGKWMRDEAEKRIGHLYPKVTLPKEQAGGEATVIAWLWARTVTCPNPACGAEMPLISSYWLSKKKGKETWVEPIIDGKEVSFEVRTGKSGPKVPPKQGRGAKFACLVCGDVAPEQHIKAEGTSHRMGQKLMSIVAEGHRGRAYIAPSAEHEELARDVRATWRPTIEQPKNPRWFSPPAYGLTTFGDLFTERQLVALTTFSDLVGEARECVLADATMALSAEYAISVRPRAKAYADGVSTYLAFAVDRIADRGSTIASWDSSASKMRNSFGRQALPMTWDYGEANPFSSSTGCWDNAISWIEEVVEALPANSPSVVSQQDATRVRGFDAGIISTDPPYYDNIGYADLSDFFYVWLRRALVDVWPSLFTTLQVPKEEELVATPYRFKGGKKEAERFFEDGLRHTFAGTVQIQDPDFPTTVYYAFKQAETIETKDGQGSESASTGWETMLEGLIVSGYQITGTWPMRTEMSNRNIASGTNALASSIVLACRVRPGNAPEATRQQFLREMRSKLAEDLKPLQHSNIAPVDLAQAAIGPGMAIYSKYSRVREASGDSLRVREALALINQVLDEVLAEQDEEYDPATRWAITWYEQHQMNEGPYGDAEGLARARNVSVDDMASDGMLLSGRGKVRFIWREELPELVPGWKPRSQDVADWVIMQRLAHAVQDGQRDAATIKAAIDAALPGRTELARDLAYRAYNIAERKGWQREALVYNTLVQNWAAIEQLADEMSMPNVERQSGLDL